MQGERSGRGHSPYPGMSNDVRSRAGAQRTGRCARGSRRERPTSPVSAHTVVMVNAAATPMRHPRVAIG